MEYIFVITILIFSIILHEVAHGYAANALGDPTARLEGRLTLNPIPHIDPFGSVILPAILVLTGANILIGWAKPVPYNPYNLRGGKWAESFVAAAGPLTNIALAIFFGLLVRAAPLVSLSEAAQGLLLSGVYLNILLAIFNLVPLPPLDGSKVIEPLLPYPLSRYYRSARRFMEGQGIFISFFLIYFLIWIFWPYFSALIRSVSLILVG